MTYYTEYQPFAVSFYDRFISRSPRIKKILFWRESGYRLMRFFFKDMLPYCTVRNGDVVIQVGAAERTLWDGRSQPLIYSRLVGPRGHVYVVEPDPVNLNALVYYLWRFQVKNITLIDKAAWNQTGTQKFLYYLGATGSNRHKDYPPESPRGSNIIVQERETEVDTLDNLIVQHAIRRIDHVNITANAAEYQILQGLSNTLPNLRSVSFAYKFKAAVESPILEYLESMGFDVILRNVNHMAPGKQLLFGMAARKRDGLLATLFDKAYEAEFTYLADRQLVSVTHAH